MRALFFITHVIPYTVYFCLICAVYNKINHLVYFICADNTILFCQTEDEHNPSCLASGADWKCVSIKTTR